MIKDLANLTDISKEIRELLPNGGVVLLVGDLASGKTTLVKNFVKMLGLKDDASSPTFSILNIYSNYIYHYDIYNEGFSKFLSSGLLESLEFDGYHFIEWADKSLEKLIEDIGLRWIKVEIVPKDGAREYKIYGKS